MKGGDFMMNATLRKERIMQNPGHCAPIKEMGKKKEEERKNVFCTTKRIEYFLAKLSQRFDEVNYLPNRKEDQNERFGG